MYNFASFWLISVHLKRSLYIADELCKYLSVYGDIDVFPCAFHIDFVKFIVTFNLHCQLTLNNFSNTG